MDQIFPQPKPRRPMMLEPTEVDRIPGGMDPALRSEVAQSTAAALIHRKRTEDEEQIVERLTALAESEGIDLLAELWALSPAISLPGALWRMYTIREWVGGRAQAVSDYYRDGLRIDEVSEVIAGVSSPPNPEEVVRTADKILRGVFTGDLADALDRAGAFCRIVSIGIAHNAERLDATDHNRAHQQTNQSSALQQTSEDLFQAARLWRAEKLD